MNNEIYQEQQLAKKLYKDIINSCSIFYDKKQRVYFKHLTEIELGEVQEFYLKTFGESKNKGLLDEKEKIKILSEQSTWSKEKEKEIESLKDKISLDKTTLEKLIIRSQIKEVRLKIKENEDKLSEILKERSELLGLTAENFSLKKSNEFLLYASLYKDNELKHRLFEEDFESFFDIEDKELLIYINMYKEFNDLFKQENLKKIAVCSFFMNSFFICDDDPLIFFGKPVVNLTQNQIELFSIAKNYKYFIMKNGKNPPNDLKSLSELVEWYENRSITNTLKTKENKDGNTYVGASKEEIRNMVEQSNPKDEIVDLKKEATKLGGNLSFDQILKIHGI